ncbi:MAG: Holliday junction ATP-dependent DNA helicase RuvA, partial [Planctomycetota bacterium]
GAIAEGDLTLLVSLPEIGKRTAQTIVAELDGKVDGFVELKPETSAAAPAAESDERQAAIADAVTLLVRLGEPRLFAQELVERAARADSTLETADGLMAAAFRLKEVG